MSVDHCWRMVKNSALNPYIFLLFVAYSKDYCGFLNMIKQTVLIPIYVLLICVMLQSHQRNQLQTVQSYYVISNDIPLVGLESVSLVWLQHYVDVHDYFVLLILVLVCMLKVCHSMCSSTYCKAYWMLLYIFEALCTFLYISSALRNECKALLISACIANFTCVLFCYVFAIQSGMRIDACILPQQFSYPF